jgi:hypothetical protein
VLGETCENLLENIKRQVGQWDKSRKIEGLHFANICD